MCACNPLISVIKGLGDNISQEVLMVLDKAALPIKDCINLVLPNLVISGRIRLKSSKSLSMTYVTPKKAREILGVSEKTLRNWESEGKITAIRTPNGHRRYNVQTYLVNKGEDTRTTILYARVSSYKQKEDLQRQANYLLQRYPNGELISEVGGGLNYKRPKLLAILERINSGMVKDFVVCHRDRLSRFGYDLFDFYCKQNNCKLLVLNVRDLSPEEEIVEDILTILHCYSSRIYGLRKYRNQVKKDTSLPKYSVESSLEELDTGL